MNPLLLGGLFDIASKAFDRLFPDPEQKAKAQLELMKLQQEGAFKELDANLQLALGQIEVNKVEAASPGFYRGGWRPAVGWTCAGGLFYQILFRPIFGWIMQNWLAWSVPPSLEMDTLLTLLFGMLGLGAYRTVEKVKRIG